MQHKSHHKVISTKYLRVCLFCPGLSPPKRCVVQWQKFCIHTRADHVLECLHRLHKNKSNTAPSMEQGYWLNKSLVEDFTASITLRVWMNRTCLSSAHCLSRVPFRLLSSSRDIGAVTLHAHHPTNVNICHSSDAMTNSSSLCPILWFTVSVSLGRFVSPPDYLQVVQEILPAVTAAVIHVSTMFSTKPQQYHSCTANWPELFVSIILKDAHTVTHST